MENILMTSIPVPELVIQIANEIESRIQKPTPSEPLPERMTIDEVTKFTGLSKSWIYKETAKKSIPHHKMGKRLIFLRSEILAWLEANTITPPNYEHLRIDTLAESARKKLRK